MLMIQLTSLLLAASCVLGVSPTASAAPAPETRVTIDLRKLGEPFRGWGTSLAWWAHGVGQWDDATVNEIIRLVTDPNDGLGLNVFRYNIGGGDQPGHHHIRRWGDVPGFKPQADSPFEWEADASQERVLMKLIHASADKAIVEAFSNSPPWWMTVSGCTAGAADGGANLKNEYEGAFADYLADVSQHFKQKHGLIFDTLEPFNEPDVKWWKANGSQEGLHIAQDQQARLIRLVRSALDQRGLRDTLVSATDANSIDDALRSLESFDAATLAALGQVNTHSYYGDKRAELRQAAAERRKPLWQSESGPLYVKGDEYEQILAMACRVVVDINQLRPQVWATWQVVAGGSWGCIHEDADAKTIRIGKKFHMLAAFTRNIRPGDCFVDLDSDSVLASVSERRGEITILLVNKDSQAGEFRISLHGDRALEKKGTAVRTSRTEDLAAAGDIELTQEGFSVTASPESITRVTLRFAR